MSFRLVDRILECVGIPHAALLLLAYIAKHARDDGTGSTIGHRLIAKRMGLEVRALAKHFATLRAHGLIQPRRRFSPTGAAARTMRTSSTWKPLSDSRRLLPAQNRR